jgi:required for meiotic nuclear division protein 1
MTAVLVTEAYSFASRFVLHDVLGLFPEAPARRLGKSEIRVEWSRDSVAFAYDFGALVFINVPEAVRVAVVDRFIKALPREPHPPLREEFLIEVREGKPASVEAEFDRVIVPAINPATLTVIASVLAQSVSIDYYDEDAQAILNRIGEIAAEVAKLGRPRGRRRDLVRFVGAAIASQVEIISAIALLDKPLITWDDELADQLHSKLRRALELAERHAAINAKLLTIRDALTALLELGSEQRMLLLEIAVVVLIAFEIVVGLLRVH